MGSGEGVGWEGEGRGWRVGLEGEKEGGRDLRKGGGEERPGAIELLKQIQYKHSPHTRRFIVGVGICLFRLLVIILGFLAVDFIRAENWIILGM